MYEQDLALNNLQGLKCRKKQPTNQLNKQTNKKATKSLWVAYTTLY